MVKREEMLSLYSIQSAEEAVFDTEGAVQRKILKFFGLYDHDSDAGLRLEKTVWGVESERPAVVRTGIH
jgi:hypothetical protein